MSFDSYATSLATFFIFAQPVFAIKVHWTIDQLAGYLSSWSATQKYIKDKLVDPVPPFISEVEKHWNSREMLVQFPIFMKLGIIKK